MLLLQVLLLAPFVRRFLYSLNLVLLFLDLFDLLLQLDESFSLLEGFLILASEVTHNYLAESDGPFINILHFILPLLIDVKHDVLD